MNTDIECKTAFSVKVNIIIMFHLFWYLQVGVYKQCIISYLFFKLINNLCKTFIHLYNKPRFITFKTYEQ